MSTQLLLEILRQPRLLMHHPRGVWSVVGLACVGLLSFGLYLQHGLGLEPCPMCIVQRYAMVLMAVIALLGALSPGKGVALITGGWLMVLSAGGAYVAAVQSWLQWYPPAVQSCGRDFYGMIETFPLKQAIPMIFRGGGDCTQVDWTFLGGSIANWSFLAFVAMAVLCTVNTWTVLRTPKISDGLVH